MRAARAAAAAHIETKKTKESRDQLGLAAASIYCIATATLVVSVATLVFSTYFGSFFLGFVSLSGGVLSFETMLYSKKLVEISDDPSKFVGVNLNWVEGVNLKWVEIAKPAFEATFFLRAFYPIVSRIAAANQHL